MDKFYSIIETASYNVVVISHEIEAQTEGKKTKLVPVAGTRNFSRNVAKYFGDVVYCEVKNKKHMFGSSTTYDNNILTGSRTDVALEDGEREASLLAIFAPELYKQKPLIEVTKSVERSRTSNQSATSILDKLKAKVAQNSVAK